MDKEVGKLPLELGMDIVVELAGTSRTKFKLVGALDNQYLILKLPQQALKNAAVNYKPDIQLVARYLYKGRIFGFRSTILVLSSVPDKLIYIAYPKIIDERNVRKKPRIVCLLPAKLVCDDKQFNGTIIDISASGCSWRSSEITYERRQELVFDGPQSLSINFPGISEPVTLTCVDKNTKQESELMCIGLAFIEINEVDYRVLEDYLHLGFIDETLLSPQ